MLEILFVLVFPLVLLGLLLFILFKRSPSKELPKQLMSLDEFIKDWLKDHGQGYKAEEQLARMKKDPSGKIYMPWAYRGGKFFIKWGLSPNKVSVITLILSFLIFYGAVMAGVGHTLDRFSQQPFYGAILLPIGLLVLFTGIMDGVDGAIARLTNKKTLCGGWFDNILDRISDTLLLVCLIPGKFLVLSDTLDFTWMIWTNVILIFLFEYMRAKHESLGLRESKPCIGERVSRIITTGTFFLIYGISSFAVMITYLIDPSAATMWTLSHNGIVTWVMLIFQISMLFIMVHSTITIGKYSWNSLKKMDEGAK